MIVAERGSGRMTYAKKKPLIALFHAAAMLSPRRRKAFFFFARLNSFSSFSLRGWTGKMFCVYAKQPLRDKGLLQRKNCAPRFSAQVITDYLIFVGEFVGK